MMVTDILPILQNLGKTDIGPDDQVILSHYTIKKKSATEAHSAYGDADDGSGFVEDFQRIYNSNFKSLPLEKKVHVVSTFLHDFSESTWKSAEDRKKLEDFEEFLLSKTDQLRKPKN